jgi:hypothetical protein
MQEHRVGHRHARAITGGAFGRTTGGSGDEVGNLKRGGSLERDQPIPRLMTPVGQLPGRPSGRARGEAREGRLREGGATTSGENPLERRKPRRASALVWPNRPDGSTDSRGEKNPEVGPSQFAGCITPGTSGTCSSERGSARPRRVSLRGRGLEPSGPPSGGSFGSRPGAAPGRHRPIPFGGPRLVFGFGRWRAAPRTAVRFVACRLRTVPPALRCRGFVRSRRCARVDRSAVGEVTPGG